MNDDVAVPTARHLLPLLVPVLLMGLTMAASCVPAYRASRIDPLRAIREE